MITVSPKPVVHYLLGVAIALDALSFLAQLPQHFLGFALPQKLVAFLDVGGEYNPQAWYSSLLLALCSLLLGLISLAEQERFSQQIVYWRSLSFIFFYLAMDEMLLLHERAGEWLSQYVHTNSIFRYSWVILAIPICLMLATFFLRFLLRLPLPIRRLFLLAGGIYVGSALILELLEGYAAAIYGERSGVDFLLVAIEEMLEKFGTILFIFSLLSYIGLYIKSIQILPYQR